MKRIVSVVIALVMVMAMSASAFAANVNGKSAKNIALKHAKVSKSKVTRLSAKYDDDDDTYDVKFTKKKNSARYSYEIAASNGRILEKDVNYKYKKNRSRKKIGRTKALKKAAKHSNVKLSVVKKGTCKYEYDDGKGTYEIKFNKGAYKYEVEILAPTGKVIEYGWEYTRR